MLQVNSVSFENYVREAYPKEKLHLFGWLYIILGVHPVLSSEMKVNVFLCFLMIEWMSKSEINFTNQ